MISDLNLSSNKCQITENIKIPKSLPNRLKIDVARVPLVPSWPLAHSEDSLSDDSVPQTQEEMCQHLLYR